MSDASTAIDPSRLKEALREILESRYFRSSAQCSSLFTYIVENTISERDECLRERVIGSEVFDRPHDYDTGNDHVVRSRASEVRKRLAQFYQEPGVNACVRISIPTGSYRATFEMQEEPRPGQRERSAGAAVVDTPAPVELPRMSPQGVEPRPAEPEPRRDEAAPSARQRRAWSRAWVWTSSAIVLALCLLAGLWASRRLMARPGNFEAFWAPMTQSKKPVLIYCGGGFVYKLSDQFLDDYRLKHPQKDTRREFFVDLKKGEALDGSDLIPDAHFVPFGDLVSAASLVSTMARAKQPYDLRYGDDVAFTELRSSPAILVGGLNNSWALRVTRNLRFVLDEDDRIVDQWNKNTKWVHQADSDSRTHDDYAVISRLTHAETGGFVLSIAGIRMYGTRAATELISDPVAMNRLLQGAPAGWEGKNMQIVIHTRAMNDIPVSINVEAVHYW